ncbi:ABC transporter permease [Anabaena minutissima FACHB-250]|nr:ABC transporter permease [Anabaena minutissima FACHB-250]
MININLVSQLFESRLWVLIVKETNQTLKNKQLRSLLIFLPIVQILLFGFTLNPEVNHLKLGIIDYAHTSTSRELISAFTENRIFVPEIYTSSQAFLAQKVEEGKINAGLVIPPEFHRDLSNGIIAQVQVLIDGVDANTAGIASGYVTQIIDQYSRQLKSSQNSRKIDTQVTFLYNPGLISSWFAIPGVLGIVIVLTGSVVSSATVLREKEAGTLEQLLMTPSNVQEILLAKTIPLFTLLMGDVILGLFLSHIIFQFPLRGNFALFLFISSLYTFVGLGIGILLGTFSRNQQQAQLMALFINQPLIQLSGAVVPIENMPSLLQNISFFNPVRHYITSTRALLIKGVGLDVLWINILILTMMSVILLVISIKKFRTQLS